MKISHIGSFLTAVLLITVSNSGHALAQKKIGIAKSVVKTVSGEVIGVRTPVVAGDKVYLDEIIRTASRATTQLVFDDRTSLSMGSKSEVKLDKFVYRPGSSSSRIVFNATRGALRFVTGKAKKSAYQINTPTASIGVRGTDFDIYVDRYKTTMVLLRSGGCRVCKRPVRNIWQKSANCIDINVANSFVLVTGGRISGPFAWDGRSPMNIMFDNRPGPGVGGRDNNENNNSGTAPTTGGQTTGGGGGGGYTIN